MIASLHTWSSSVASAVAVVLIGLGLTPRRRTARGRTEHPKSRRRAAPLDDADLIAFLDSVAGAVRAGESVTTAVRHASRSDPRLVALLEQGSPRGPGQQLVVQAIEMAVEVGGHVGPTLDGAAAVLRQRQAIRAEARAHSAQARLSARVLTWLPIGFAALIACGQRGRAALTSPLGLTCLLIGAVLNGLGWLWMRQLVRGAQR